jgi:cephalosporin-C deacetylase-like acetyl esterase
MYVQRDSKVMYKNPKKKGCPSNFQEFWNKEVQRMKDLQKEIFDI